MLKVMIIAAAGILTLIAMRHVMAGFRAAKARVQPRPMEPRPIKRLRQDPRSGVYYPDE